MNSLTLPNINREIRGSFPVSTGRILIMLLLICALILGGAGDALAAKKKKKALPPYNPKNASILIEADSGMVLQQNNADWTLYPASLTKIMTLLLTFEALDSGKITLQSPIKVSSHAASMPPSRLAVPRGQSITVEQAIKALVTKSANDIAVAVAEKLGGSERGFATLMNLKARELGMSKTHFVNASGLHNVQQYTSVRDMARLAQHIIKNERRYYPYFSLGQFYYGGRIHENHNKLMKDYSGMDGLKTGYVTASGFNLVASAKRNGVRLIGVVIGGKTASLRNEQMKNLLDDGFKNYARLKNEQQRTIQAGATTRPRVPATMTAPPPVVNPAAGETAALTAPSPLMGNSWSIQIGAFQDRISTDQAIYRALQQLPAPLNRGEAIVMPLRTSEAKWVFRARIGGYSKVQAEQACRVLTNCLVISPAVN